MGRREGVGRRGVGTKEFNPLNLHHSVLHTEPYTDVRVHRCESGIMSQVGDPG